MQQVIDSIRRKTVEAAKSDRLPVELSTTEIGTTNRRQFLLEQTQKVYPSLFGSSSLPDWNSLEGNIENFVGFSTIPTGVIGPVRVIGSAAHGDFFVPMATTEGALVASYHRGAKASYLAGGATSICLVECMQRSPVFKFENLTFLGEFLLWVLQHAESFQGIVGNTSRHARLQDLKSNIEGNHLILTFEFHTGDASGQNMVTLCTNAICQFILEHCPIKPAFWFIEGNYSGDKKATALAFTSVRGKKVTSEIEIPEKIVTEVLKSTPRLMTGSGVRPPLIIRSGAMGTWVTLRTDLPRCSSRRVKMWHACRKPRWE